MSTDSGDAPVVPMYYWAGRGSATVHRLKGFTFGIDAEAYDRAYDEDRLRWLRDRLGVNFVFLSYNWGLPPEDEAADWRAFALAAARCHALGMRVAAYVQPSNAVSLGSYATRDWYATTPRGRRIPYYNGRFFTCLNHPAWRVEVLDRVRGAIEAGADAIFLDNCAFGGMPIPLNRDYTAFAGCFCQRCQSSFKDWQAARGQPRSGIPRLFRPGRARDAREFAHWRAWTLTGFIREIRGAIDAEKAGTLLLTNTVGAVNVNTYNVFGVDLPEISRIVDWLFVENLQSPRADHHSLVQNAGTFKLMSALQPGKPTLSIAYERGIGVDGVPAPRNMARAMAEGYAAGGVPVVRGGEYVESGAWTLLQPGIHEPQAAAVGQAVAFVSAHPELFAGREHAAVVAVCVPAGLAWRGDIFPDQGANYFAVFQALIRAAIPFRVVLTPGEATGMAALILPDGVPAPPGYAGMVLAYSDLGIEVRRRSLFDYFAFEPLFRVLGPRVVDGYYSRVHVRRFVDRLDLLFKLVFRDQFALFGLAPAVAARLRALGPVAVIADRPVYADLWRAGGRLYLHLVNYSESPAFVRLQSPGLRPGRAISLGPSHQADAGFWFDDYAVVELVAATEPLASPWAVAAAR